MKTKILFSITILCALLTSCSSSYYYQVFQVEPTDPLKVSLQNDALIYKDSNCIISYCFWADGGNPGFKFHNKTNENIFINLGESFFIQNGEAYNYYQNRVYTNSKSIDVSSYFGVGIKQASTTSKTNVNYNGNILNSNYNKSSSEIQTNQFSVINTKNTTSSSGYSVSYEEPIIICIPANSFKIIEEYTISQTIFRSCNIFRFPSEEKGISTQKFMKEDSPLYFSNQISYKVGRNETPITVENAFFVTEISNCTKNTMIGSEYRDHCGKKSQTQTTYWKRSSPNKFYIEYTYEY